MNAEQPETFAEKVTRSKGAGERRLASTVLLTHQTESCRRPSRARPQQMLGINSEHIYIKKSAYIHISCNPLSPSCAG